MAASVKLELVGQPIDDALGNDDILGESSVAAVVTTGNTDHLPVIAEVDVARAAVFTLAAVDRRVEGHAVSGVELADPIADHGDRARRLVPHHQRRNAPSRTSRHTRGRRCRRCRMRRCE